MTTQMFNWKRKNLETNEIENCAVQGSLRPIELWEYVFPKESLGEVLTMLNINKKDEGNYGSLGQMKLKVLRKMLGKDVKNVPEMPLSKVYRYIETRGLGLYPIGIKEDVVTEGFGYKQEML